ncbi:ubiquinol-cytochrome c reductase iron-sulfur subunit [Thermodesulfobacteriota bacterium B35]
MPPANRSSAADPQRRQILVSWLRWSGALLAGCLAWPLTRFIAFRTRPKPRYVTVAAPLPLSGYHAERDFFLFLTAQGPRAVSRTCTHLGCRINYLEDRKIIECPCHQSRFTTAGRRVSGPAKRDLPTYPVETRTDEEGRVRDYVVTL